MAASPTSISTQVKRCLELNTTLSDVVKNSHIALPDGLPLSLEDQKNRFAVWCGNISAHRTGTSSLEHRLRDASHIREMVISLLDELENLTNDAKAILAGEMTPWDQMPEEADDGEGESNQGIDSEEDMPGTEIEQIAMDIKEVVDSLLRLSITIRNPAPHDRFLVSSSIDTSHFEAFDIQHVQSKFEDTGPWLAERLGKAISRRRQYFKYRQKHHEKLAYGMDEKDDDRGVAPSTLASSIPDKLKKGNKTLLDDDNDSNADWTSQTSFATSIGGLEQLHVPPLPKEAEKGPFECPFCFMIVSITARKAWKKHVFADLRPYVCLEHGCVNPDQEFGRRHEWLEHMKQKHWTRYSCPLGCQSSSFTSASQCKAHLESVHPGQVREHQVDALIKLHSEDKTDSISLRCSLCNQSFQSLKSFRRHVGRHQEQLSLFALPPIDDGDGEDQGEEEADHDSVSVGSGDSKTSLERTRRDSQDDNGLPWQRLQQPDASLPKEELPMRKKEALSPLPLSSTPDTTNDDTLDSLNQGSATSHMKQAGPASYYASQQPSRPSPGWSPHGPGMPPPAFPVGASPPSPWMFHSPPPGMYIPMPLPSSSNDGSHRSDPRSSSTMGFSSSQRSHLTEEFGFEDKRQPHMGKRPSHTSHHDEDRKRIPPPSFIPARSRNTARSPSPFDPPPQRPASRGGPLLRPKRANRRSVGIYDRPNYDEEELFSADDLFHDNSHELAYGQRRAGAARSINKAVYNVDDDNDDNKEFGVYPSVISHGYGRRSSVHTPALGSGGVSLDLDRYHNALKYQNDINGGPQMPLTAETLRRTLKHGDPASNRSMRSTDSRDESKYERSHHEDHPSSASNPDDITIKISGTAVVRVEGAEIECDDGEITFNNHNGGTTRIGSEREITVHQLEDGRSRIKSKALPLPHRLRTPSQSDA